MIVAIAYYACEDATIQKLNSLHGTEGKSILVTYLACFSMQFRSMPSSTYPSFQQFGSNHHFILNRSESEKSAPMG